MLDLRQTILPLDVPYLPNVAQFHLGEHPSNAAAHHAALDWLTPDQAQQRPSVLTWGAAGTGKTLLAQALAHESGGVYLHPASNAHVFAAASRAAHVVVDDIHAFDAARAIAAFDIFNQLRSQPQGRWWATSRVPPAQMTGVRADLSSRMGWGLVFELLPLADDDCVQVMQSQAARLGFTLNPEAAQYLLMRLERNLSALAQHLASLNRYALMLKKPINQYLVQQWYTQVYLPQHLPQHEGDIHGSFSPFM